MKTVDDITLIKLLGKGSFGEVYLSTKKGCKEYLATKKIPKKYAEDPKIKKYFQNEIKILREIKHKNIMKLYDVKITLNHYYLICELCNGGSLTECLDKYRKIYRKPFTEEIVQYLMIQIIDAIKYLHSKKIIHRDLKLDNILVNFSTDKDKNTANMLKSQVKIIDFGFATHLKFGNLAESTLGSPINMDPKILEKLNSHGGKSAYDEKADIWSLGTVCYEMLIGKATFDANDMNELVKKVEKGVYTIPTYLSKEVVSFLNAMLQYDAKCRLSAEELSRHHFLRKNVKDFTKIDLSKVKKNLKSDKEIQINVKNNKSIWAIFNDDDEKALADVPGYILEENSNLQTIPEDGNYVAKTDRQYTQKNKMINNYVSKSPVNNMGYNNKLGREYTVYNQYNNQLPYNQYTQLVFGENQYIDINMNNNIMYPVSNMNTNMNNNIANDMYNNLYNNMNTNNLNYNMNNNINTNVNNNIVNNNLNNNAYNKVNTINNKDQYIHNNNNLNINTQGLNTEVKSKAKSPINNNNLNNINTQDKKTAIISKVKSPKIDNNDEKFNELLEKTFDIMNEEFVFNEPMFIPIVPGTDPAVINPDDKYNEDENF